LITDNHLRLDGWKSIAAHFGRERTTVIRWATERGMPVHRIPGAGRSSVYALTEELDAWLDASRSKGHIEASDARSAAPSVSGPAGRMLARSWRRIVAVSLFAAGTLGFAIYARPDADSGPNLQLPRDAEAAEIYVEARADWARRTPQSILEAIGKLRRVVAIEPGFTPGYTALADSFLLAREFGSLSDLEAFGRAQLAVDTALKIDPNNASALRAKAFIAYWWHGDRETAGNSFRRALAIDAKSAQTQFWFANALIDNGDFDEGMRRFAEARLLEPASPAIATDLAWARWSVGETRQAQATLVDLRRDNPSLATIPDYLSVIALADGGVGRFVDEIERMASLRREEGLTGYAAHLRAALANGPEAVAEAAVEHAVTEVDNGDRQTLVWPAFVASSTGDRATLLHLLRKAEARNEVWGSAGLRRHMTARWKEDAEVASLLEQRQAPSLLTGPAAD
jgi:tetratricopeptide (TPR) repeat protein